MNRTHIEWVRNPDGSRGYTWNPITGCRRGCPYCYARKMARRFSKAFPRGFEPTFHPERLGEPLKLKKPSTIFVCSMGEMFGHWVDDRWVERICAVMERTPQHTYQVLTKYPETGWLFAMPDNVWFGATVTGFDDLDRAEFMRIEKNKLKFISFEPLLERVKPAGVSMTDMLGSMDLGWVIVGAQTNPKRFPKKEWVEEIIGACDDLGIPVFLKDNLGWPKPRQNLPQRRISHV